MTPNHDRYTYLIDMGGRVVHRWGFNMEPGYGRLLDNGNLLMSGSDPDLPEPPEDEPTKEPPPFERHITRLGGYKTTLQEVDWDGNVLWEYDNRAQHHDFLRLANGNTMVPEWVELPKDLHKRVRGGHRLPRERVPRLLSDDFVEVDPGGNEVNRIHLWQLLDPAKDPIDTSRRRWEWTHTNAIDMNSRGDIAFSCKANNRVGVICGETGELKLKVDDCFAQHHANWVGDDRIMFFDNGRSWSRVLELDATTGETVWSYQGEPIQQFFSGYMSSAERLSSGSVFICEGSSGRLFEVTDRGEVVWEWINPFANHRRNGELSVGIYRAHRYAPEHPAFAGRDLDPEAFADLNRLNGLV
ncbi:MAG: aryl-sulfate sulfotransferase [Actinomycetota bacterium]